jgi:hypothetical protein
MFRRVYDPGLPSWPALFVNHQSREAYLSVRVSDWRSIERSNWLAECVVFVAGIAATWFAWRMVPAYEEIIVRGILIAVIAGLIATFVSPACRTLLPPFFSRTIFARRLKVVCTPDWIAFKSWYYVNGVRMSRHHGRVPLSIGVMLEDDREAKAFSETIAMPKPGERPRSKHHLHNATVLVLLIRSIESPEHSDGLRSRQRHRAIPIAGMEHHIAERIVVLINAALEVAMTDQGHHWPKRSGHDLDLISTQEN